MPAVQVVRERIVDAPVDAVWSLLEPVERIGEWFAGIDSAKPLGGRGPGRRQRLAGRWGRRRFEVDQTVFAHEPGRVLAWRHDAERLDGRPVPRISRETELRIELEAVGLGTRLRLSSRMLPGSALAWPLVRLIAAFRVARMLEGSLDRVAGILARRPPGER